MEKPDEKGFVHITWPSRSIPYGGIFHPRRVEPSSDRQEFLKVLLEESKMDIAQRKKTAYMLRQEEENKPEPEMQVPLVRPRTSKRRSLSAIRESGIYEPDDYKPQKRGEDREKLKDQLAFAMAYGDCPPDLKPTPEPTLVKPELKLPTNKEKWHDLVSQIRERVDWLAEMEALGQAEPHRDVIQHQINERLRAMDALGIDSECSSARSGFSTLRSREPEPEATVRSNGSRKSRASVKQQVGAAKAGNSPKGSAKPGPPETRRSTTSQEKLPSSKRSLTKQIPKKEDENVSCYEGYLTPLKYSPRRRV